LTIHSHCSICSIHHVVPWAKKRRQERERRAEEGYSRPPSKEGRVRQRAKESLTSLGTEDFISILLLRNIKSSPLLSKCCQNLNIGTPSSMIFIIGTARATFQTADSKTLFGLLSPTAHADVAHDGTQMKLMLERADSPYIRLPLASSLSPLRGPPDQMYRWIEQYLYDQEVKYKVTVSGL
jgi:hypothetical protein